MGGSAPFGRSGLCEGECSVVGFWVMAAMCAEREEVGDGEAVQMAGAYNVGGSRDGADEMCVGGVVS